MSAYRTCVPPCQCSAAPPCSCPPLPLLGVRSVNIPHIHATKALPLPTPAPARTCQATRHSDSSLNYHSPHLPPRTHTKHMPLRSEPLIAAPSHACPRAHAPGTHIFEPSLKFLPLHMPAQRTHARHAPLQSKPQVATPPHACPCAHAHTHTTHTLTHDRHAPLQSKPLIACCPFPRLPPCTHTRQACATPIQASNCCPPYACPPRAHTRQARAASLCLLRSTWRCALRRARPTSRSSSTAGARSRWCSASTLATRQRWAGPGGKEAKTC